ncbi:MAG: DUF58 domain-containing protein [Clostridia bacterium]|nr:DUF58 domain-containing protein [Clostridia bacterium]
MSSFFEFLLEILLSPWFWCALGVLCLGGLLLLVYRRGKQWALAQMRYARSFSIDGIFVGETIEMTEIVRNSVWFPLFSISVEFFVPAGLTVDGLKCSEMTKVTSIFWIPPYSTVSKKHVIVADRRDHYRFNTATVTYRSCDFEFSDELDFYAYPNIYNTGLSISPKLNDTADTLAKKKYIEDPFFVSGIAPYYFGAPMRSVNFKVSARFLAGGIRQLMCNRYDSSQNLDSMILLDVSAVSQARLHDEERVELGLRYACFLFCEAVKHGANVGFSSNCAQGSSQYIDIPCGSGERHTKRILEAFAEITWYSKRDYSVTALLQRILPTLDHMTDLFLITASVDDELAKVINQAEQFGYAIHIIMLETRGPYEDAI